MFSNHFSGSFNEYFEPAIVDLTPALAGNCCWYCHQRQSKHSCKDNKYICTRLHANLESQKLLITWFSDTCVYGFLKRNRKDYTDLANNEVMKMIFLMKLIMIQVLILTKMTMEQ